MSVTTKKLHRGAGLALLAVGALSASGCPEDSGGGDGGTNFLGDIAEQCGLECPEPGKGVALGNASVTGYGPIDSFFRSVVNFSTTADGVVADINEELAGIRGVFGITDAELAASANLGAAIKAKIQAQADIVVNTTKAKCEVDADVAIDVSAKCQAEANCEANPGMASFNCMGTCEVEIEANAQCSGGVEAKCEVTAPDFECKGECSGSCAVKVPKADCNAACSGTCSGTCTLEVPTANCAAKCTGTCGGTCTGGCMGTLGQDGVCNGTCTGTCTGQCSAGCEVTGQAAASCQGTCRGMCSAGCEVSGEAALNCDGTCNGTCTYTRPSAGCDVRADVKCELTGSAAAMCTGSCEGNFEPPSASCKASASCQASAKAEARFQVKCTPPRVDVKVVLKANASITQAQLDFWIAELGARLPRLSASVGRANVVTEAGVTLSGEGRSAVTGTISAIGRGEVGFFVFTKIGLCTKPGLDEAVGVIATAKGKLDIAVGNAGSVANTFNMLM